MKHFVLSSLAASVAVVAAPVSASPDMPQAKVQLAQQSAPKPGTAQSRQGQTELTRQQAIENVQKRFKAIDSNNDGFVTEAESDAAAKRVHDTLEKQLDERGNAAFARLDSNKDGSITQAEYMASATGRGGAQLTPAQKSAAWQRVSRLDANKDGVVSKAEFDSAQDRIADRRSAAVDRMFEGADSNKDGKVSLAEATSAATAQFDAADTNRDGKLSREEMLNARKAMQSRGAAR